MELRPKPNEILFVDLAPDEASSLIKLFGEADGEFRMTRFILSGIDDRERLKNFPFEAAVFNCDYLGRDEVEHLTLLSIRLGERPILVCANQIALQTYRFVDRFPNIVTLQKPFRAEDFAEKLRQVSIGADFRPKVCPRFLTSEAVEIVLKNSGKSVPSRMTNYSAGGMFLEVEGVELSVGDEVQVTVREKPLSGRIVWCRTDEESRISGVGLQFT